MLRAACMAFCGMKHALRVACLLSCLMACREEVEVFPPEETPVDTPEGATVVRGFYLLNEGNMGTNKATLDYYNCETGTYLRNIYAGANPSVPKELGDVGNDIQIYGSKMYAVINCSNKVEVMEASTARRLGQIDVPNCRYIRFHGGYAYVTSYAGPVELNPDYRQRGYVAKVDTTDYREVARCIVGYQPDELAVAGDKIYVANSGGYRFPNYETSLSVIDIPSFTEIKRIDVAANLHRVRADRYGSLWISSRGDYYSQPSRLYRVDTATDCLTDSLDVPVTNLHLDGDSLYFFSVRNAGMADDAIYGIIDVAKRSVVSRRFITDGTDGAIQSPYGITVHPETKDIYLTDARNHISPGRLYCFDKAGRQKWSVIAGDIPAHMVFVR
jgi:DNA-binding beta-propeller fold protein YncE